MQIDYKRDLNHTYVILQEEKEPDGDFTKLVNPTAVPAPCHA